MHALEKDLREGLQAMGLDPAAHPCDRYLAYVDLLSRWNRAYNLSGIREPRRMLSHHVLDSLSVLAWLHGARCLDVGSGAGLPGIVLALARSDTRWTLLDANGKKTRFLRHCMRELGLRNVEVIEARIEDFAPGAPFDTIISRAFASTAAFFDAVERLLAPGGVALAMKGPDPGAELAPELLRRAEVQTSELRVPGVEGGRTVVVLKPRPPDGLRTPGGPVQ